MVFANLLGIKVGSMIEVPVVLVLFARYLVPIPVHSKSAGVDGIRRDYRRVMFFGTRNESAPDIYTTNVIYVPNCMFACVYVGVGVCMCTHVSQRMWTNLAE
jgi:hypothetical protein